MHTTNDLLQLGNSILRRNIFLGVFPQDGLPHAVPLHSRQQPVCLIYNTDTANLGGTHWIALICFPDGYGEIFDSFGRTPSTKTANWMRRHCTQGWNYNKHCVQGHLTTLCGLYCLYYLYHRIQNRHVVLAQFIQQYFPLKHNDVMISKLFGI